MLRGTRREEPELREVRSTYLNISYTNIVISEVKEITYSIVLTIPAPGMTPAIIVELKIPFGKVTKSYLPTLAKSADIFEE